MYRPLLDFATSKDNDATMGILWRASLVALFATSLAAQSGATAQLTTINGMVTDLTGRPLVGTEVRLVVQDTTVSVATTDEDGRFAVAGSVQGRSRLHTRRLGFKSRDVELFFPRDSTRILLIQLEAAAQDLAATEVQDSSDVASWWPEFQQRRETNSLGRYFTRDEILKRQPQFLSEILRTVPGVSVAQSRTGGFSLRMRGCRYAPMIWIDGTRARGSELDEVARVDDVGAMEVYPTPSGVPAQYLDRSNVGCGTILVWTRQQ